MTRPSFYALLFLLTGTTSAKAQTASTQPESTPKKSGYHSINLNTSFRHYFMKENVENPETSIIHPNNTNGFTVGVAYNRVTRYGLIIEGGLDYGQQSHDILIHQNLENFDPLAKENLAGAVYERNVSAKLHYIAPRFMLGYRLPVSKQWALIGKAGFSQLLYLNGMRSDSNQGWIMYKHDNANVYPMTRFNSETYFFGESESRIDKWRIWDDPLFSWEFYLGGERSFSNSWVKRITMGAVFTKNVYHNSDSPNLIEYKVTSADQEIQTADFYVIKNLSLGLQLGIGLW